MLIANDGDNGLAPPRRKRIMSLPLTIRPTVAMTADAVSYTEALRRLASSMAPPGSSRSGLTAYKRPGPY